MRFSLRRAAKRLLRGKKKPKQPHELQASFLDFNYLLHELRTIELRCIPACPPTLVSVGCAGGWYFDWIHTSLGTPHRHVGVEFFSPRPDALPDNVEWIQNTASDMSDIADHEADMLFSGQNVEHLLPGEIARFFLEAHRVLKPGGRIVLDSPNRLQTTKLLWNHPEHFIEFTPDEITQVLIAAGFSSPSLRGLWLCEDPRTGRTLPLTEGKRTDLLWRSLAATDDPDRAFVWWAKSERRDAVPDRDRLDALVEEIVARAWPDRISRFHTAVGEPCEDDAGRWFLARKRAAGAVMHGPYVPLEKGDYSVTFLLRITDAEAATGPVAAVDVVFGNEATAIAAAVIATTDADADGYVRHTLTFTLADITFGVQFRVLSMGSATIAARREVNLTRNRPEA